MLANDPILPSFLVQLAETQVTTQVLPFWTSFVVNPNGGLYGAVTSTGHAIKQAEQGALLTCRALWSYSSAALAFHSSSYLQISRHIYNSLAQHFINPSNNSVYWAISHEGRPIGQRQHLIAQTYAIFALAKYYEASQDKEALSLAMSLVAHVQTNFQSCDNSYCSDIRADYESHPGEPESLTFTCNQLHTLEAFTQLYIVKPSTELKLAITTLLDQFIDLILPASGHLPLSFDKSWQASSSAISIGHNFEAPWLVCMACHAIDDHQRLLKAKPKLLQLVDLSLKVGRHETGCILNGYTDQGQPHIHMTWWQQTEASNALYTALMLTGDNKYRKELLQLWNSIEHYWIDNLNGEWHSELSLELVANPLHHKADTWRSIYHITRACLLLTKGWSGMALAKSPVTVETQRKPLASRHSELKFSRL